MSLDVLTRPHQKYIHLSVRLSAFILAAVLGEGFIYSHKKNNGAV